MLVELIDHLEEVLFEELVPREFVRLYFELGAHHFGEFVDEELVTFELDLFAFLGALVFGSIEEVEGGHCVGVEP